MNRHPGGIETTARLLAHAGLLPGMSILDLGAGDGETVRYLKTQGLMSIGIDKNPGEDVREGDFLALPFEAESFDACISQCAFLVSGNPRKALSEAYRVLKPGGWLLLSDVHEGNLKALTKEAGFSILWEEDITPLWREYYLEAIWNDSCCNDYERLAKQFKGKRMQYHMLTGRKE